MKKTIVIVLGIAAALLLPAGPALADTDRPDERGLGNVSTIAVYGDSPYGTSNADTAQFDATPSFINSINVDPNVSLVIHVGDIHSGKQYCTQPYDQSIFDRWAQFQDPLVYTPGDNEWTDCHKAAEGGNVFVGGNPVDYANGDPVARRSAPRCWSR
jgi:Calcineurin-like phosphoesterase